MREHIQQQHAPDEYCREVDHPGTCTVCNLYICSICGGSEGSLLPECPGRRLTADEDAANYQHYVNKTGPFSPEGAPR